MYQYPLNNISELFKIKHLFWERRILRMVSFMGTKGSKPISALEKRQRRMVREERRVRGYEEGETGSKLVYYDERLVEKVSREIKGSPYVTPYMLMSKLNVSYSVAKGILRELEKRGEIRLYSRNRRVLIYIPVAAK